MPNWDEGPKLNLNGLTEFKQKLDEKFSALNNQIDDLASGILDIDKTLNWQAGWINTSGLIASSTASQFALVTMYSGEKLTIGTRNSNITIIGSTSSNSVSVGDTVTVIQKTTSSNTYQTYTYTATATINIVVCVRASEYNIKFEKAAPFMATKQDVLTFDSAPINGSNNPVTSSGIYDAITQYFYISPNIADPTDFVVGEYVNQATGAFTSDSGHTRTGYVPVSGGQDYCIANTTGATNIYIRYAFYNSDKTYISGAYTLLSDIDSVVTAPTNAAFLVMSATGTNFPFMVALSDTAISYEEYGAAYLKPQYSPRGGGNAVINLPEKIYALVGYELNVYFENISENWEEYDWDCSCSVGMQLVRGYRVTPTTNGTYTLTITAKAQDGIIKSASTTLIISSESAGSGTTKSVIVLGDSTTYNGTVISKLHENFSGDVMGISTIGTMGTAPNNHEGRPGWTLNDYFTKASITYPSGDPRGTIYNPFYNPSTQTFDADYYFTNSGVSKPDWFFINMGINDMFSYTSDSSLETQITTCIGYLNSMITSIKSASANTKIGICVTIPPNDSQDAFGKAYSCDQKRNRYKRNNVIWAAKIIEEFDGNEANNVYIVPIHTNLDTVYNMGFETLPVNARNTGITYESAIANGGVHPAESGYWQIADVYTAFLKGNE